jgi:hypothetical protein
VVDDTQNEKDKFFTPIGSYRGEFTPENLAFNSNLQEFAQKVSILCSLETGGKIPTHDAYQEIKRLWKQLKASKEALLDQSSPPPPDLPEE